MEVINKQKSSYKKTHKIKYQLSAAITVSDLTNIAGLQFVLLHTMFGCQLLTTAVEIIKPANLHHLQYGFFFLYSLWLYSQTNMPSISKQCQSAFASVVYDPLSIFYHFFCLKTNTVCWYTEQFNEHFQQTNLDTHFCSRFFFWTCNIINF